MVEPVEILPHPPAPRLVKTPPLGKFWTVANILSLVRLALGFPIFYVLLTRPLGDPLGLGLVFLAVLTDWFDGKVARWSRTVSEWGKVLDPIADKVVGALAILALTMRGDTVFEPWFLAMLVTRDVLIVWGSVVMTQRRGRVFMSVWSGKLMVAAVALTVVAVLLRADPPIAEYLLLLSAVLIVYSFFRYLLRYIRFMRFGRIDEREPLTARADSGAHVEQPVGEGGPSASSREPGLRSG